MNILVTQPAAKRRFTQTLLRMLAAGSLLLTGQQVVWAHAHASRLNPAPNSSVATPAQVCVTFDDPIEGALSHLTVHNAKDDQVNTEKSKLAGKANKVMCVSLPQLVSGTYQVKWAVVSRDGHRSKGGYAFTVK